MSIAPSPSLVVGESAGPRLDAWVAEYVREDRPRECGPDAGYDPETGLCRACDPLPPPPYSQDDGCAWRVVAAVVARGYTVSVTVKHGVRRAKAYVCEVTRPVAATPGGPKHPPHRRHVVATDSMPKAVCRAAVLAVLAEES
jgi:hypothetical protein